MKVSNCYIAICIVLACLTINSMAQNFTPLITSPRQETVHFADLLNDQILSLNYFDSHFNKSFELRYDTLLLALPLVNSIFSSLTLYDNDMQTIQHIEFPSTKDSIFIFQNFLIDDDSFSFPQREDAIVLFGTLLTPNVKTRVAIWLDYDFNMVRKIVYDPELYFYIKAGGVSSHFIIDNIGNLLTNVNGSTVALNKHGKLVKKSKYLLGRNYLQNKKLDFLAPYMHGLSISDRDLNFVDFKDFLFHPVIPVSIFPSYKYVQNLKENYIMLHITTTFDSDCNNGGQTRNAIIKYNTTTYEAELFYIDKISNCINMVRTADFSIDNFTEDYIYTCRKYNNCDFIDLDDNGENTCTNEFVEVQCIDQNGQLRWQKNLGGDAAYLPKGIVATADSGCVVFTNRYANGINTGKESDLYYVKLDKEGNVVEPLPVSVNPIDQINKDPILFYPNPAKDVLYFKHNFLNAEKLSIEIYDFKGRKVLSQKINKKPIPIKHLPKGMYTYIITQNQKVIQSHKLLK